MTSVMRGFRFLSSSETSWHAAEMGVTFCDIKIPSSDSSPLSNAAKRTKTGHFSDTPDKYLVVSHVLR